jgi:hypothetical protein
LADWFECLAKVPGVSYERDPSVRTASLPGYGLTPQIRTYEINGLHRRFLLWLTPSGGTSVSPARERGRFDDAKDPPSAILHRLHETLELPGTLSDYHTVIQGAAATLWNRRREDPSLLAEVERLCWLNIRLIEEHPETIAHERDGVTEYFSGSAYDTLITLYEREGFVYEALAIAERAARFNAIPIIDQLKQRIELLKAEDAG